VKFNKWSLKRIRDGKKTLTSRRNRHEDDPHVEGIVGPLPWWFIKTYLYRDEGADSPKELQGVINQVSRRKVHGLEEFFVHIINPHKILEELSE
jgi:hypothetical protein